MTTHNKNQQTFISKVIRYATVLTLVCLASGAGISLLYVLNIDKIEANERKAFEAKLATVLSDAIDPQPLGEEKDSPQTGQIFVADIPSGGVRYVASGKARGYQSEIEVLVAVDADEANTPLTENPKIFRMVVLSSAETPGLGENINAIQQDTSLWGALLGRGSEDQDRHPAFQAQFSGKRLDALKIDTKTEGGIIPVTGATITSKATTLATRRAVEKIIAATNDIYGSKNSP
jgi:Na+-translocating ferredoxin:NAD+ oxidoreductase RnfG subunit